MTLHKGKNPSCLIKKRLINLQIINKIKINYPKKVTNFTKDRLLIYTRTVEKTHLNNRFSVVSISFLRHKSL